MHKEMSKQRLSQSVNVLLTPQFYTLKREAIPVQYAYQAKRIAPSLFDGLLDDPSRYSYFVSKEEEGWLFIAYDMQEITDFLASKGMGTEDVSKIFFAEQSASLFTSSVKIGSKEALLNLDGSMVIVPQIALDETVDTMQIDDSFTPKKGVVLEGAEGSVLGAIDAYVLAGIFVLFGLMFFVEGSRYGGDGAAQEEEMNLLLEDHPSLQSSYTRDSIASKYKAIDKKEREKREVIRALSHVIFKGSTLNSLNMNDKNFQALYSCKDATVMKKLEDLAKKENLKTLKVANTTNLKIEGTL